MDVLAEFGPFHGGEFGLRIGDPPTQSFSGENVFVMQDGSLMPRNGLKVFTPTGLGSNPVLCMFPVGDLYVGVIIGTTVYTWAPGNASVTNAGSVGGTPSAQCGYVVENASSTIITVGNVGVYRIGPSSVTSLGISAANSGGGIAIMGDRLWISNLPSNANRIVYSDAAAYGTISASNFFDLGGSTNAAISLMYRQRDSLFVTTVSGTRTSTYWRISGTPGSSLTVRPVGTGFTATAAAPGFGSTIWALVGRAANDLNMNIAKITGDAPVLNDSFNQPIGTQTTWAGTLNNQAVACRSDIDVALFMQSLNGGTTEFYNRIVIYDRGTWTCHRLYAGFLVKWVVSMENQDCWVFCDGGAAATAPKFYTLIQERSRVQTTTTLAGLTRDNTTAFTAGFHTPMKWLDGNRIGRAQAVVVDFRQWNTSESNSARYNHYDVSITTMGVGAGSDGVDYGGSTCTVGSHDTVPSAITTDGARYRSVHYIAGALEPGNGFEVSFTNMRGVAIERVQVLGDVQPSGI